MFDKYQFVYVHDEFSTLSIYTGAKFSSATRDRLREYRPQLNYVSSCFDMIRRGNDRSQYSHCVGHNLAYRVGLVSECEFILIFNNSRAGEDTVCLGAIRCSFLHCYRSAFVSRFRSYSFFLIRTMIRVVDANGCKSNLNSIYIFLSLFYSTTRLAILD
jgi:hypothetical protein